MTSLEIEEYRRFLARQVEFAQAQHDSRASGAFGPERNTPEQLALCKGFALGYQAALEELEFRLLVLNPE